MSMIEYVIVMHDGCKSTRFMSEDYCKDLMEQLAAAQSREVCTVAHEDVDTCGYCQRDKLRSETEGAIANWTALLDLSHINNVALMTQRDELRAQLARAEGVLRVIANTDYRGNRSTEAMAAQVYFDAALAPDRESVSHE
jgi:hypothetical protein